MVSDQNEEFRSPGKSSTFCTARFTPFLKITFAPGDETDQGFLVSFRSPRGAELDRDRSIGVQFLTGKAACLYHGRVRIILYGC